MKTINSKVKTHIRYKSKDGTRIPGVTTITGELGWNKRVLINWANRMGLEGIDCNKYRDDKADIGTLAHAFITDILLNKKTDTSDYSENQINQAKDSVRNFVEWKKNHKIEPVLIEKPLISEKYMFGGTLDIYGKVDGYIELLDLKSGSGIYPEFFVQTAAYGLLLTENGYEKPNKIRILNIPRSKDETFQDQIVPCVNLYTKIFLNCLKNYYLKKKISNNQKGN